MRRLRSVFIVIVVACVGVSVFVIVAVFVGVSVFVIVAVFVVFSVFVNHSSVFMLYCCFPELPVDA